MSRFSKHDAKAQGWSFVHAQKEESIITSGTQGESRTIPGRYVAEKYINGILVTEAAETEGRLLEQIHGYEERQKSVEEFNSQSQPLVPDEEVSFDAREIPEDASDEEAAEASGPTDATVVLPGGRIMSERAWSQRERSDVLVIRDEEADEEENPAGTKQVVLGPHDDITEAVAAVEEVQRAVEDRRTREADVGKTVQIELDPVNVGIDAPGATGTGTIVVRKGEKTPADVRARLDEEAHNLENERVVRDHSPLGSPAPEDAPELAGVDVGITERGDLSSEVPRVGATYEEVEAAESVVEVEGTRSPATIRSEAVEQSLKDKRDEDPIAAEKPDAAIEARVAGGEAVQKAADEAADDGKDDEEDGDEPTPDATEAAAEFAKEHDVDLEDVDGSGSDGRITKPDVEAYLDAEQDQKDAPAEESAEDGA
jgi:hypothetical protein